MLGIIDSGGNVKAAYRYNAWGEILCATGELAELNPLRYRGYYYDSETGLYYVSSRYYDPEICRWINADGFASTGQGFVGCNMFAYCLNNPVNLIDRTGHDARALAAGWGTSMWWLTLIDGPLPIGDILYYGGLLVLGGLALAGLDYVASNPPIVFAAEEPKTQT